MNMRRHRHLRTALGFVPCLVGALAAAALLTACEKRSSIADTDAQGMVELLMPQRIELVEAFTGFRSFDSDDSVDGIEVLVRPLDTFGDPVKIAGTIRFELYSFQPASAEPANRRLCEPWEVSLVTQQDQKRYWNLVTGMYEVPLEFPAGFDSNAAAAGRKFVLEATYTTPLGTHMTDQCEITAPARRPAVARR